MSFALIQVDAAPHLWRELMDISAAAFEAGARLYPQVAARPFGMLIGFAGNHAFTHRPTYRALAHLSPQERALELVEAGGAGPRSWPRPTCRSTRPSSSTGSRTSTRTCTDRIYAIGDPPDYEPTRERTVAAIAEDRGVTAARGDV